MNDIHLYIDAFPNRIMTSETEMALTKILTLFQGSLLRITWLYHGQRLSFVIMLQLILAERRLCKGRGIVINNAIWFKKVNAITSAATWLLSDFSFSVVLSENTSKNISRRLQKKQIDLTEQPCLNDNLSRFLNWLESNPTYKNEVYSSYIRIALGLPPYSCKYQSCLGKTIYIDKFGKMYSCPFMTNRIELNDLENCSHLQDLFDTHKYVQLIQDAITRRGNCQKTSCGVYRFCLGGCPLDIGDCPENGLTNAINAAKIYMQESGTPPMAIHREICNLLSQQFRV